MKEAIVSRVGPMLSRLPGGAFVLDLRAKERERRARRRALGRVRELSGRTDLRINVGAGSGRLDGWLNIDIALDPTGRTLHLDATEPWPFGDGSAVAVNSEHFIEHIDRQQAPRYFDEAFRVLCPGGVIRTSTPSLRGICATYLEGEDAKLAAHRSHGYDARGHGDMVNNYFYSWGHRHIYDFETLELLLAEVGFEQIALAAFGDSAHPALRGIDTHDMGELAALSLAVDAVKPA